MNTRLQAHVKAPATSVLAPTRTGLLQRKCACGGSPGRDGECEECRRKRLTSQRRCANDTAPSTVPPIVREALRSPGQPLEAGTRAFMESRFGHHFGEVRVHTDVKAAESAQAVNALAYTVERDIVFSQGRYEPGTPAGRRLLAHELTHVVQQSRNGSGVDVEQRADAAAERVARGQSVTPQAVGDTAMGALCARRRGTNLG